MSVCGVSVCFRKYLRKYVCCVCVCVYKTHLGSMTNGRPVEEGRGSDRVRVFPPLPLALCCCCCCCCFAAADDDDDDDDDDDEAADAPPSSSDKKKSRSASGNDNNTDTYRAAKASLSYVPAAKT